MTLQTLAVIAWFTILIIVLVLMYFYYRDRKTRKITVNKKPKPAAEKRGSDKSYTIVLKEDGSVQVLFGDGEAGERPPSGRAVAAYGGTGKAFANRNQLIQFLGGAITRDLAEVIPEENGTYVLILHVWKNEVTPIEATLDETGKECRFCETQNDSDAKYCKKCGKQLK